jgi:hypothetical protein
MQGDRASGKRFLESPLNESCSVTYGKPTLSPWGELLKPNGIDALWAYVVGVEE